jgi:hypothetical protein
MIEARSFPEIKNSLSSINVFLIQAPLYTSSFLKLLMLQRPGAIFSSTVVDSELPDVQGSKRSPSFIPLAKHKEIRR